MLNLTQSLKQIQKLSPQQIQLIKLLEIPTVQLEQRIKREIEENPVLEEGGEEDEREQTEVDNNYEDSDSQENEYEENDTSIDSAEDYREESYDEKSLDDYSPEDYYDDDETPNYRLSANNYSDDDERKNEIPYSQGSSLHETLLSQLGLGVMNDRERLLAEYIIGNIDDDGYLRRDLESIADDIAFSANVETTEKELQKLLVIIQDFDPSGVGARDIKECLMIQIVRKYKNNQGNKVVLKTAYKILHDYFPEFTKKHYEKILSKLDVNEKTMRLAIEEITHLNPKPGSIFGNLLAKNSQHIIPDFILEDNEGELILHLNSKNVPELRLNKTYSDMIENMSKKNVPQKDKDTLLFVKQKLDSAKWFIEAIRQRQNTLMETMHAIIDFQHEYFQEGDETKLKPMILKDIAEKTGFDISTISRVANSKYIQTHFGIFPLKFFFSEGMQTDTGEEVSTREIKKILKECIEHESKQRPLTDEKLAQILQQRGYQIARRTVAKYREQMNILVARLRKEL
ncbi:MAG: RNA polymerase factor sigma-54 [Bacteroidales bacterium]|nr:RNA polymerase factor sigma-54 [Bacteroidales bacterium]MBR6279243.1 RNA polymerase factor sigma-54 [Bacteroidales bacterium]